MRKFSLVPPFVFDNDCISSFLWVRLPELPVATLKDELTIPQMVVDELSLLKGGRFEWVPTQIDEQARAGRYDILDFVATDPAFDEYLGLTDGTITGKRLGKGESAVLALVKHLGGTVASNNLSDVSDYCSRQGLELICTDDIMCLAVEGGLLSEQKAYEVWEEMKARRRRLPGYDFPEALHRYRNGLPKQA